MLPSIFLNQDGDPFLAALYRSVVGGLDMAAGSGEVRIVNHTGGVEAPSAVTRVQPRYQPIHIPASLFQNLLQEWRQTLHRSLKAHEKAIVVDVLIPTYRMDSAALDILLSCQCSDPAANIRYCIQVDRPYNEVPDSFLRWKAAKQAAMLHRLLVRINGANLGASATRNRLLDASTAEYVVFWDDDVQPAPGCLDAYVAAIRRQPTAAGFAGPTYLPHAAGGLVAALHLSDVSFFWEAPADPAFPNVPWAVTANICFRMMEHRFSPQFPKSGGGEDVDLCARLHPGRLCSVPTAAAHHPLWSGALAAASRSVGVGKGFFVP
ncbi:hypothetical protein WJX72_006782 [[Myrmecia] bisecta]|uniref:Glycosyltransferase 2-like domain-containing protein n=1 Tax=[Myrmecia] bisecta TaxID=41462 RepID=A0AAW1QSC7_9CHLO